jgi:RNA 3'-terminal phosphate cyclase (ATP)
MITIDGSRGEGGGQILRTSLALSLLTGQPFRLQNIRARRSKPGLMRQHLTAVQAASQLSGATCEGDSIGSEELLFKPGEVKAGSYSFAIGTAGSVTLVLQTILPALLTAPAESTITLAGGTHNPFAPPWDFLSETFLPVINRMGPRVETELIRPGFYPAGGGKFEVSIIPAARLTSVNIVQRGEIKTRTARAIVANLPRNIADRELQVIRDSLNWTREELYEEEVHTCNGQGNVLILELESEQVTEVITGFGERGVPAETVATNVVDEAKRYLVSGAPVGAHLADQLMLPFALAGGGSFLTLPLSLHSTTNIDVIRAFLDIRVSVENLSDKQCMVIFG